MARIGVLALQGDFAAHAAVLTGLGVATVELRDPAGLSELDGLVLPGGESTTLLNLMQDAPWFSELRRFHAEGGALFATCAGAILLAREVHEPAQPSLGLLDAVVRRNGYGRQVDSFETEIEVRGFDTPFPAVFIRAPRFVEVGTGVEVLAWHAGERVLLQQGRILAATFHTELTEDFRLHRYFADMARREQPATV